MRWSATPPNFVQAAGGKVLGAVRYPFPATTDFSSFLLQAQASPRQGASASPMPAPTPSTASSRRPEFGLTRRGMKLAALLMFITDVHALGPADRRRG